MAQQRTRARVGGSGFTTLQVAGVDVAFLTNIVDRPGQAVAQADAVHPLGSPYPTEVAVAGAIGMGTLTATVKDFWDQKPWQRIKGFEDCKSLYHVLRKQQFVQSPITIQKLIRTADNKIVRAKTYYGIVMTNVDDNEDIDITKMTLNKTIEFAYTHTSDDV